MIALRNDLRDFLEKVDAAGQMLRIDGVDWNLEMGGVAEIVSHARSEAPAVLFDNIPGYPKGFRVLSGGTNSARRVALAMNLPEPKSAMDLVRAYRDRMKTHAPIPHRVVERGPVLENVDREEAVDLYKFPVPRVHEEDGGRYIGTHDLVIMRDPDGDWVNAGTYRVQVHDTNTVGIYISPGKHGRQIRDKYFERGQPCPVLVSCGQHPVLYAGRQSRRAARRHRVRLRRRPSRLADRGDQERTVRLADAGRCGDRARRRDV